MLPVVESICISLFFIGGNLRNLRMKRCDWVICLHQADRSAQVMFSCGIDTRLPGFSNQPQQGSRMIISAETNGWHGSELGPSGYRSDSFGVRRQSAASDRNQTVCMATAVFAGGRRCSVPHVARRRRFGFRLVPIQSGVGSVPTSGVRCDQPITGDYPNHRGIRLPPHSKGR